MSHMYCDLQDIILETGRNVLFVGSLYYPSLPILPGGLNSAVGIATRYRLDGLGIESRLRGDFSRLSRPSLGSIHPPVQCLPVLSRGGGGGERGGTGA